MVVLALVSSASCGSDSSVAPTQASIVGTWDLVALNGSALPAVIQANPKVELLHDQLVFASNGTFTETYSARFTSGTAVTTDSGSDSGTYTVSGGSANMVYADQSSQSGSIAGSKMTIIGGSFTQVYQKQ